VTSSAIIARVPSRTSAYLLLEDPFEFPNPGLRRGLLDRIALHGVLDLKRLFKQAVSEHHPVNMHYYSLTF
jgi:hypothetical protein